MFKRYKAVVLSVLRFDVTFWFVCVKNGFVFEFLLAYMTIINL